MTDEYVTAKETDAFFGLVAGLYAAALAAPAVAIGVALQRTTDSGALVLLLLGSAIVVAAGIGWIARRESLAVRLGARRWVWATMAPPLAYFAGLGLYVLARGADPPGVVAGLAIVGAVAGVLFGLGLAVAARNRHARAVLADAEEFARFEAAAPEHDREIAKRAGVGSVVVGVVGFVVSVAAGIEPLRWVFQVVAPLGAGLVGMTGTREVAVTDRGLLVATPLSKTVRPWSDFESYSVTREAVVVRRAGWSAGGLLDLRRNAGEVDDVEAVAAALGRMLPRRERGAVHPRR